MNIKSEAKIGLIVLATVVAVIWGINYLKGKNVLERSDVYYAVYKDVAGLDQSAAVLINGYKVGLVNNVRFIKGNLDEIIVAIAIDRGFELPEGSVAELYSDLLGTTSIRIIPGVSQQILEYGDTLKSRVEMSMLSRVENEILPVKTKVESLINTADSLLNSVNNILDQETAQDLKISIENLKSSTGSLNQQLNPGGSLYNTINDLEKISSTLAENRNKLDTIFANIESISDSVAQSNITQTINHLNTSLAQASGLIQSINNGKGSIGQLATNDSLYLNLQSAVKNLDILLKDLNENPKKYVHFSLFGGKD